MKKIILFVLVLLVNVFLFGCSSGGNVALPNKVEQPKNAIVANEESKSIVYKNIQFGFSFSLPESWKGYKLVTDIWQGLSLESSQGEKVVETGPIISIRHPQWTKKIPRQDIPIMIFTIAQWNMLQQEKFHIGAAPIGPKELGRNNEYVFALPARYNFAFSTGYKEVENILNSNPLHPI